MRSVCKKISSPSSCLFCRFCWDDSVCSLFSATTTQLFSKGPSSRNLCSCLENLSGTKNFCNFWRMKFQQVNTYAFCSWDDIFTQEWNCGSPNNFDKCTETSLALSTNTSIEWILYFSWCNYLVTSFMLEKNNGGFSKHQNKSSDTGRFKGFFHRSCLSSQFDYY